MNIQHPKHFVEVDVSDSIRLPVIAGVEITTDEAGRFNLNALHRASGTGDHKRPSKWLATEHAKALIEELQKNLSPNQGFGQILLDAEIPVSVIKGGVSPGTFAHELLAISYAGWISPAFQLQVNQVFLDYRTGRLSVPVAKPALTTIEILQLAMESEQERLRLEAANHELVLQMEAAKPKVEALDLIATADGSLNLTEAAKALQQQPRKFNQYLSSLRWIYKRAGGKRWLGYQDKVQQGLLEHKVETITLADGSERLCEQVRITPKGLTKLAQQFCVGGVQ
ncbi:phage antirepressor KilAC domain-containing protein [Aeromonas hydrophila]|uniref:phage antirepressor KilAC domain-containing protein n=1 Tax=Aeromonas hydrophila TaxID=644 RepID=UPI00237811F0|nr:phage antirepressor KilAC domain-containing protein [Aeromonas hydrophila]MDD9228963.1 phage antirepressor KilAC domain-containing protein [Aeromonas hydrophila]